MPDFERTATVAVGADAAFALLSDPVRLPEYLATAAHVDSIAVDGDPAAAEDAAPEPGSHAVHFLADTRERRVEWGSPASGYSGSAVVTEGLLAGTCRIVVRLHTTADADGAAVERVLDESLRSISRILSRR